ncbi:hypothetical protein Vafri_2101, partial [Volvox africanus]
PSVAEPAAGRPSAVKPAAAGTADPVLVAVVEPAAVAVGFADAAGNGVFAVRAPDPPAPADPDLTAAPAPAVPAVALAGQTDSPAAVDPAAVVGDAVAVGDAGSAAVAAGNTPPPLLRQAGRCTSTGSPASELVPPQPPSAQGRDLTHRQW